MSEEVQEFPYVMVPSGMAGKMENTSLNEPIYLSEGEAEYTNQQLAELNCSEIYVKLEEGVSSV